ncbi:MAG: SDR family oxidoreductase [Candidatus Daviesbacteria bacterium]|nr:SDR family oxidoreductase [Candidatus Daviesbacteria bacterium]
MVIKNILVTGSDGYIGAVLVNRLLKQGYNVTGIDNFYFKNIELIPINSDFKQIKRDIRKLDNFSLKNFDAVIHLAALSNDPMGALKPKLTKQINYCSTVKLAKLAKKQKVKKFIFSSSCSIYGSAEKGTVDESSPVNPLTAYATSKILSEGVLKKLADKNFCVGIMRNSTVYGFSPKFRNDLVVNNLTTCAIALNQLKVFSDGSPWRPLIDVRDLADIFIEFIRANPALINGEIINIGFSENNLRVKEVVECIHKQLPQCDVEFNKNASKDNRSYRVNFSKFKKLFPHITQKWPIQKSIKDLISKLKQAKYSKEDFVTGKYTRLQSIQNLLSENRIDKSLFWKE